MMDSPFEALLFNLVTQFQPWGKMKFSNRLRIVKAMLKAGDDESKVMEAEGWREKDWNQTPLKEKA